jgi:hypothetical protein
MIDKMQVVMLDFKNWYGMPNVMGVIHGIHICITKPTSNFSKHYYYHKTKGYNIMAQVVVDNQKKFMDVFVGLLGSVNDLCVKEIKLVSMCIAWGPPYLLGSKDYQLLPCFMNLLKEKGTPFIFGIVVQSQAQKGKVNC